jgi:FkbM family methyltransferase
LGLADHAVVEYAGTKVAIDLLDPRMFFVFGELNPASPEFHVIKRELSAGDTFLDVGANHGSFSLLARNVVGPSGKVLAFEPQPRLAEMVRTSFRANGFNNCTVEEVALSDREGSAPLHIPASNSGEASVYEGYSAQTPHEIVQVRQVSFDRHVRWRGLPGRVVVKLDVEGSESAFLTGASQFLRERMPTILFELNPTSAQAAGHSPSKLVQQLRGLGYMRFIELARYPEYVTADEVDCSRQRNLVAKAL